MVLRAVRLAVQAALLLQVLQRRVSAESSDIARNFQNTELSLNDRTTSVSPAKISNAMDQTIQDQEERSFSDFAEPPSTDGGEAVVEPTGVPARPSTKDFLAQHGKFITEITGKNVSAVLEESAKKPVAKTTKDPNDPDAATSAMLGDGSGEEDEGGSGALGGAGGAGSKVPSFDEFMKEFGSAFESMNLFGNPALPQNHTVNDDDILLGELYGGKEHGDVFSDVKNIKFEQAIRNITIRGAKRVDQIGLLASTDETVVRMFHGGKGGGMAFLVPDTGDAISSVEVHWDKHDEKTCIFFLQLTTSGGKTISAGTKTANTAIIKPPEEYQIAGFYGRADGDGIFCIGAVFAKIGVVDLAVTDVVAVSSNGSPDIYNYNTTIRNWVGPMVESLDTACYQKRVDISRTNMCPTGYRKDGDRCIMQCPLDYPVDCLMECIPQNSDCVQEVIAKAASVVSVALNLATMGVYGAVAKAVAQSSRLVRCAIGIVNSIKSLMYYLRMVQTIIPVSEIEKLMDEAFKLQIVLIDLPFAVCACLGVNIPNKLQFTVITLAVVSAIVMMAIMIGEALFSPKNNILLMLREVGVTNTTIIKRDVLELHTFLDSKNGTCGYEMQTLTNRVIGKVQEIRGKTPGADEDDVRVEVSRSPIIMDDIYVITNHCMGEIWSNYTSDYAFKTRALLRKTLGVIINQLIDHGTTDMGKNVKKKDMALQVSNMGLFILTMLDPTGIAWMAAEFVQPICGPTEYIGEIDDGTLYDALGLHTVDDAFSGSYGIWKKKGNGSVTVFFESVDKYDVDVFIYSGGDKVNEVHVRAHGKAKWTAPVKELQDKNLYMDRWRPGLFGLPGSGGGSLLLWVPRSSQGGQLILHARLNAS